MEQHSHCHGGAGVAALVAGLSQEEPARITAPAAFDQGMLPQPSHTCAAAAARLCPAALVCSRRAATPCTALNPCVPFHLHCPEVHICDTSRPELTAQYLLVVDALNFCFWQDPQLEYADLAGGIKVRAPVCAPTSRLVHYCCHCTHNP